MESPVLLGIASVLLILYAVIAFSFARPLKKHNEKIMNNNSLFNAHVIESINGEETLKTLHAESDFQEKKAQICSKNFYPVFFVEIPFPMHRLH